MDEFETSIAPLHRERMRAAGMPEIAIRGFLRSLRVVREGGATTLPEASLEPVEGVTRAESLESFVGAGRRALAKAVVIKLNGGLGTSMGLRDAKSLLPVREDLSFLDLIARQVLSLREQEGTDLPLVLMNSFRTRASSLEALARYPQLAGELALDFLQHRVPRVDPDTLGPVEWSANPDLEWCPPGHGDLYAAIESSGLLDLLLASGRRYAFVSNADNLGGTLDLGILGWFASSAAPFLMEVADRTAADMKGGHLARRDGRLILRESAQCAQADRAAFQDIERHAFFNTNNLWIDLEALRAKLDASPDGLPLPVIRNEKHIVPDDPESPRCLQLETAMGAAIECFEGAEILAVTRDRFAPVKTTNDLLVIWSDAYELSDDGRLVGVDAEANRARVIDLDPRFYATLADLAERFPHGAPSLRECRRLTIRGDHRFGASVRILGEVTLENRTHDPVEIPEACTLG